MQGSVIGENWCRGRGARRAPRRSRGRRPEAAETVRRTVCPAGAVPRFMQWAGWGMGRFALRARSPGLCSGRGGGRGWRPQAASRRRRRANGRSPFRRRSRRACGPPLPPAPAWADAAPHHGGTVQENPVIFAWRRWTRGSFPCGPCAGPASHARLR